jgi:hypothetical protein
VVVTAHAQRLRADQADRPRELGAFADPKAAPAAKTPPSLRQLATGKATAAGSAPSASQGRRAVIIPAIGHHLALQRFAIKPNSDTSPPDVSRKRHAGTP